eukprot:15467103-Alexandrium_andersonii.AAC.1
MALQGKQPHNSQAPPRIVACTEECQRQARSTDAAANQRTGGGGERPTADGGGNPRRPGATRADALRSA